MSSIKEKLTQSVRQARATQPVKTASAPARDATPATKAASKPAPAVKAAAVAKPAPRTVAKAPAMPLAAEPASSASTLFPQRVWPD